MLVYLVKRLAWAAVTLMGVTLVTFLVVYRIPADPAAVLAGPHADPGVLANIRRQLKLDQPVWVQYGDFAARLLHGDLGTSYVTGRPVGESIGQRLPATFELAVVGWLAWLVVGTLIGVWVAARPTPLR